MSIANDPVGERFLWRNIIEYSVPSDDDVEVFENACKQKDDMRDKQNEVSQKLKLEGPKVSDDQFTTQCKIMLRIARQRGINVQQLLADDYTQIKLDDRDEKRNALLETLDEAFSPNGEQNRDTT